MIKKIRSIAKGIGSKILMGLLILTFGVWGIEGMVMKSGGSATVAKIGDMKITYPEYQMAISREHEKLRQMLGKDATPDIIKSFNIEPQVLQHMVDEKLLILASKKIGLRVSDEDVANNIRKDPSLLDDKGKFSKRNFEYILHANGMSEKAYIEKIRNNMAVNLMLTSLISLSSVPQNAAATLYASREEKRNVDVYTIPASLVNSVSSPSNEQLKKYYDSNIALFTAPEYRTISYVLLTADEAKNLNAASKPASLNHDIETAYHERIEEFKKPERRRVDQLLFGTEEAALKAIDEIKSGKQFEQVAKEPGVLNPKTIALGLIEKANLPEESAAQVFSMDVGIAGVPIKSSFGWHVFRLKEILPPMTQPLEEVRAQLEKDLEQQAGERALTDLSDKLEDNVAGGSTLAEAAKELGLKVITLPPIDKKGQTADGTLEKNLPGEERFLDTAFKTDEKTESSVVNSKNGTSYMLRVESLAPEHVLPLEQVKAKAISGWIAQEKKKQLAVLAKKIAADFANTSSRANAIKTYNLANPFNVTVSQKNDEKKLPATMVSEIFSGTVSSTTNALPQDNQDYAIAVIKEIIPVAANENDSNFKSSASSIGREYNTAMQNELVDQYLRYLAMKYPPSVNKEILQLKSDE